MKRIALYKHHPECSNQCCDGMINALSPNYQVQLFSHQDLTSQWIKQFDIVAFPGGIGDSDFYYTVFKRRHGNVVADYVQSGGYFVGICMGAYWAGSDFFDILTDIEPVQYIKRPNADIRRPYSTIANVDWLGQKQQMFFYDGCALIGDQSKCQVVSRYSNGDPMAIIQGRIGLIGCHPESEQFWYNKPYLKQYWHEGKHHNLLLEFVNQLTEGWPSGLRHLTANET